ncbi:hypothetical protein [Bartonella sp. SD1336NMGDW]
MEAGTWGGEVIERVIIKFYLAIGILGFVSYREGYTEGMGRRA